MDTSKLNIRFGMDALWLIFIDAGLPIHVWVIILVLYDISWVAERTNYRDAIGFSGYGITFALIESLIIWIILILVGFILLRKWGHNKRVALLSSLILAIFIGAIVGQLLFLAAPPSWPKLAAFLGSLKNPMLLINGILAIIVGSGVLALAFFSVYSERFQTGFIKTLDRLAPLMGLYLILDLIGVIIIIIRNIG